MPLGVVGIPVHAQGFHQPGHEGQRAPVVARERAARVRLERRRGPAVAQIFCERFAVGVLRGHFQNHPLGAAKAVLLYRAAEDRAPPHRAHARGDSRRRFHADALQQRQPVACLQRLGRHGDRAFRKRETAQRRTFKNRVGRDVERRRAVNHRQRPRRRAAIREHQRDAVVDLLVAGGIEVPLQAIRGADERRAGRPHHAILETRQSQKLIQHARGVGLQVIARRAAIVTGVEDAPHRQRRFIERKLALVRGRRLAAQMRLP